MTPNQIDLSPESLKKVGKKIKLDGRLKELNLRIEKLKIRSEIEGSDLSEEINKFHKEIEYLKQENEQYNSYNHPLIDLFQKQKKVEKKLKKLEEKRNQIQPSIYESLKSEYIEEKTTISNNISETIIQLKKIERDASKGTQTMKYAIEELSVRKDIEEIPENEFNEQISNLKQELSQSEELNAAVRILLELVEE